MSQHPHVMPGKNSNRIRTALTLAAGVGLWILLQADRGLRQSGRFQWHGIGSLLAGFIRQDGHFEIEGIEHFAALGIAFILFLIPAVRRFARRTILRLRGASPRGVRILTAVIFLAITGYLFVSAIWEARDLFPKWHDQQMTLIQAQMLAHGRLWMPEHPCADFFETFYVMVRPVYAAIYFPGAALFYVPTVWLHLPFWLQPLLVCGAVAALLFRVVTALIDPAAGLLAVVFLTSLWIFRLLSLWEMSHTVLLLLSLWAFHSWLRWRATRSPAWAVSLGIALGWAAITRPLDALCYAIPLGLAMLLDLRRESWRRRWTTAALVIAAAVPFLSLQLVLDRGLTGRWGQTPFQHYYETEFTGISPLGRLPAPDARATSDLPQKQLFGRMFVLPTLRQYASQSFASRLADRAERVAINTLPSAMLIMLVPLGLLPLREPRRIVLFAPVPLFLLGYSFYPLMLDHYCLAVIPGVILCVLLGMRAVADFGTSDAASFSVLPALAVLAILVSSLPEFHPMQWEDTSWPAVTFNYDELPSDVKAPALVLYRYWNLSGSETRNFNDEPIYNVDVPWPDDAPIIRAHDLGDRDSQIIEYYGRIQPRRNVYLVDRTDLQPHLLGQAGDLARELRDGVNIRQILPPR